jgi:hypothetical protein
MPTDEEKLLAILNDDRHVDSDTDDEFVAGANSYLDGLEDLGEEGEALAKAVRGMLSPEEIIAHAKIAEHNQQVHYARMANLAKRRAKQVRRKKRRRR